MTFTQSLPDNYVEALKLIDGAHAEDPNTIPGDNGTTIPYELHYAKKMTRWLAVHTPDASPALQLACRAQHFRRWQLPRTSHPPTRTGYLTWRAKQKSLAASQLTSLLSPTPTSPIQPSLEPTEIEHIASLVRKDGLLCKDDTKDKNEVQILEDVACLVFLDDQFDSFEQKSEIDEDKMVNILKKTWGKMGERGRELALGMELSERARVLIGRALEG